MADTGNGNGSAKNKRPAVAKGGPKKKTKKPDYSSESDSEGSTGGGDQSQLEIPPPIEDPGTKLPQEILNQIVKEAGQLLIAGQVSWDLTGKRETNKNVRSHPNLNSFHRFTDKKYRAAVSGCVSGHSVLINEELKVLTFGRNSRGQLGIGNMETMDNPTPVEGLKDECIIMVAVGRNHTLFLNDRGIVYACGDNKSGQCGIGTLAKTELLTPVRINYRGPPIVKVACGGDFSMILDVNGAVHSFGLPEHGQLGHNTDGNYFISCNKLSFHFETSPRRIIQYIEKTKQGHSTIIDNVFVVDIACGQNHSVCIDSKKRAFSWGFGGVGSLGHAEPKNEMRPRLIKFFDTQGRGVRSVYCGASFSMAVNDSGTLYLFGQPKKAGEANMYPKPIQDLAGWVIHDVGASNTSIVVAADETLVVWGPSPTFGELGLGDMTKTSPKPKEVKSLNGVKFSQVSMGYSHTLVLSSDTSEEALETLGKLSEYVP